LGCGGIVYRPTDDYPVFQTSSCSRISGDATTGEFQSSVSVPATVNNRGVTENNPVGVYKVYAYAQDAASNSSGYVYIGSFAITGS
jgi:hypothetical protein